MNRNVTYLVIGALVVAVAVVGYLLYQERQQTSGGADHTEAEWHQGGARPQARQRRALYARLGAPTA